MRGKHLPCPEDVLDFALGRELYVTHLSIPNSFSDNTEILLGSDVKPCVWSVVEVDVAIVCACLPTFRPLFDRKVRRSNKRGQSVELATDHSFAPPNRRSGYENVEAEAKNQFLDLVRKNWAAVPSVRNSLEWRASSRVDRGMEGKSAGGAKDRSLVVEEWHTGQGVDERNDSGGSISN